MLGAGIRCRGMNMIMASAAFVVLRPVAAGLKKISCAGGTEWARRSKPIWRTERNGGDGVGRMGVWV